MKLAQLVKPWLTTAPADCLIRSLHNDSRLIEAGDAFIAYPGALIDGRFFINEAVAKGAVAVLYDPINLPANVALPDSLPCVAIPQLTEQLGEIGRRFYSNPGSSMNITGVTGTNGKTTIAYQLAQAHDLLGKKAAYIGTIGQGMVNALLPLNNTTPDALCLQKFLYQYNEQGIETVCMEVSSHALSQHRVDSIAFNQAIYTNLTLDHLDYHHSMEAYAKAKAQLFARPELEWAILNRDDPYQGEMSRVIQPHVKKLTYGLHAACDVHAVKWQMDSLGTEITVRSPWGMHELKIQALGQFNIYNGLALLCSLLACGYDPDEVVRVISQLKSAPGRMELVINKPSVLVDYAHTPDALDNALSTLSQIKKGQLWVIFGCGGDRDKTKRPIMGEVASRYADHIVITSDNPRSEDPGLIIEDIAQGIPNAVNVVKLLNREEAIAYALNQAEENDIILIAGKGHETYQQIGSVKHVFSDQDVVRRLSLGSGAN